VGYTPGYEGPHPSELPVYLPAAQAPSCGHTGYLDRWRGDETTGPGWVFSCGRLCGKPGSQTFQPDEQETDGDADWPDSD
jgi:hypothetical protein